MDHIFNRNHYMSELHLELSRVIFEFFHWMATLNFIMAIINYYGMHEKVRHRMTSLFSVCPPITCIIGFMVKCAWIGTSDMNYPPWPFLWWVIGIFSLSLIIRFCFSQKRSFLPKSSCPVYQTFQPGEDLSAHAWTSDPIKTNTAPYFSCHEQNPLSPMKKHLWFLSSFFLEFLRF